MRFVPLALVAAIAAACSRAPESAQADQAAPSAEAVAAAESPSPAPAAAAPAIDPLTERFWMLSPGDGRPGAFRIFLSSGAMMQGSCVETYRVSAWRRDAGGAIVWTEDGADIAADVVSVDGQTLTLSLALAGARKVETYAAASAPFVCPDLPR